MLSGDTTDGVGDRTDAVRDSIHAQVLTIDAVGDSICGLAIDPDVIRGQTDRVTCDDGAEAPRQVPSGSDDVGRE
jgi:hypothetical protein